MGSLLALEIVWHLPSMEGGICSKRVFQFLRDFSLYLVSLVVMEISLDRWVEFISPVKGWWPAIWMTHVNVTFTVKPICAPQTFLYPNEQNTPIYNVISLVIIYLVPMTTTLLCYGSIMRRIDLVYRMRLNELGYASAEVDKPHKTGRMTLLSGKRFTYSAPKRLRNEISLKPWTPDDTITYSTSNPYFAGLPLTEAKTAATKLAVMIVGSFAFCWTPCVAMNLWYMLDAESAMHLSPWIQEAVYLIVSANAIANPLLYAGNADMEELLGETCGSWGTKDTQ
ncbi:cholecystokinin receptor type A-like [Folsomia candida]|uniref:cholecystokinin receptor type A-like n=1 Tax=Folsomia candida TaxID=158441 RepID=UPI001604F6F4|nr:cholecystokinin receptor type A-like [Folsomia candida]